MPSQSPCGPGCNSCRQQDDALQGGAEEEQCCSIALSERQNPAMFGAPGTSTLHNGSDGQPCGPERLRGRWQRGTAAAAAQVDAPPLLVASLWSAAARGHHDRRLRCDGLRLSLRALLLPCRVLP